MTDQFKNQVEELKSTFSKGVYFFCPAMSNAETAYYSHSLVCLAEGLRELGIPVHSNVDYWQVSADTKKFLLEKSNVQKEDCSVVVLDNNWFRYSDGKFPQDLFKSNRGYKVVYIDGTDKVKSNAWDPKFREFDLILRHHMLNGFVYPENFYPWTFGLSQRQISQIGKPMDSHKKKFQFLVSFRNTKIQHSVRRYMITSLLRYIEDIFDITFLRTYSAKKDSSFFRSNNDLLYNNQTGKRHSPEYFDKLSESLACACFAGFFITDLSRDSSSKASRLSKYALGKLNRKSKAIVQWDSFRLWESLAAGCVSLHVDFDRYRFLLPEKPENWKHYIGIDFDNPNEAAEKIRRDPNILYSISKDGREWVIRHYAPMPVAVRFLELIDKKTI